MTLLLSTTLAASLLVSVALVAAALLRHRSAALRHWVIAAALVCAAALPLVAAVVPPWHTTWLRPLTTSSRAETAVTTAIVPGGPAHDAARNGVTGDQPVAAPPVGSRLTAWVVIAWSAGTLASGVMLLAGLMRLRWIGRRARRLTDGRWVDTADDITRSLGLRRPVTLLQSDHPTLLVTWGLIHPRIVLPEAARRWSEDRARFVLRHELAHVSRGDWAVQVAGEALRVVHWFNPLVWYACRRLREESERACDDAVLMTGVDGADYAAHLVDIARTLRAGPRSWLPAPAIARHSSLEGRISAMLHADTNRTPISRSVRMVTASLLVCGAALLGSVAAQSRFATFSGTVLDPTSGYLPDAVLVMTNVDSDAKHEVRTDRNGRFEFVGLTAGEYALSVRLPGFATLNDAVTIAGRDLHRIVELQVGSLEETVTVMATPGAAPSSPVDARQREFERAAAALESAAEFRRRVDARCGPNAANAGNTGAVGGSILAPRMLVRVNPVYPEHVSAAGVAGAVRINAIIGLDGRIREMQTVGSPNADLERAALDAVGQWQFSPTLLNCTPIEVRIQVTTNFKAAP